jgi:hypothetical protein
VEDGALVLVVVPLEEKKRSKFRGSREDVGDAQVFLFFLYLDICVFSSFGD